jgi:hypothetical protein
MITWNRHAIVLPDGRNTGYAHYTMLDNGEETGIWVRWCGHPTALYKYFVRVKNGTALDIYDRGGVSAFRTVGLAKAAAETYHQNPTREDD